MVIVLCTAAQCILLPIADKMEGMHLIKKKMGNAFYWYDGDLKEFEDIKQRLSAMIDEGTIASFAYEIRPLYKGKIDLSKDMTAEEKEKHPYFNRTKKDLSDKELEAFLQKNSLS